MIITVKPLDYGFDALEPVVSARTMQYHHGKHYAGYISKTGELIKGTEYEDMPLKEIVRHTNGKADPKRQTLFNNAAQASNHEFFWKCMSPNGGGEPGEDMRRRIEQAFGSLNDFRARFIDAGTRQFGSGWVWLVAREDGLRIMSTGNAELPPSPDQPLLVCDVWEHAYYLDYQNERGQFLKAFMDRLANWQFVERRLLEAQSQAAA